MVKGAVSRTQTPAVFHEISILDVDSAFSVWDLTADDSPLFRDALPTIHTMQHTFAAPSFRWCGNQLVGLDTQAHLTVVS